MGVEEEQEGKGVQQEERRNAEFPIDKVTEEHNAMSKEKSQRERRQKEEGADG